MKKEEIKELVDFLEKKDFKRVHIKNEGFELDLERESINVAYEPQYASHPQPKVQSASKHDVQHVEEKPGKAVTSPMVGTFYNAASPDHAPFVKVGDTVDADTVVGIVEAMKVMNEVKAGIKGTVTEVLVDNGQPVEFGTNLFKVN